MRSEGFHEVPPLLEKDKQRRPSVQLQDPGSRGSLGEPEADFNLSRSAYYLMVCVRNGSLMLRRPFGHPKPHAPACVSGPRGCRA